MQIHEQLMLVVLLLTTPYIWFVSDVVNLTTTWIIDVVTVRVLCSMTANGHWGAGCAHHSVTCSPKQ